MLQTQDSALVLAILPDLFRPAWLDAISENQPFTVTALGEIPAGRPLQGQPAVVIVAESCPCCAPCPLPPGAGQRGTASLA